MDIFCKKIVAINTSIVFFLLTLCLTRIYAQDLEWTKTYGGTGPDRGYSVQQTADSGYIIVGTTFSFGAGGADVYLIKTDVNGDSLWTRTYGGPDSDGGHSVKQTNDGGYIIAGCTESFGVGSFDLWFIKTDSLGDTLWTKAYGGAGDDEGRSVQQTNDGGYIIGGWTHYVTTSGVGNADIWFLKTNGKGDTLWTKTFGGLYDDFGYSVQQTADSGYIIVGTTLSFGAGGADVYFIKTDVNGDSLWTKTYGGVDVEEGRSVQQTSDGGYIIAGWTRSFATEGSDVWLVRTDSLGDTLWTKAFNESDIADQGHAVWQTTDGGFIIAGMTLIWGWFNAWAEVYVVRTDSLGNALWTCHYGPGWADYAGYAVQQTVDRGYIVTGMAFVPGPDIDVWLLKIASEPGVEERKVASIEGSGFGPTIFSGPLILPEGKKCKVFDITGRVVEPGRIQPGIYFIEIDGVVTKKVVKIR